MADHIIQNLPYLTPESMVDYVNHQADLEEQYPEASQHAKLLQKIFIITSVVLCCLTIVIYVTMLGGI